MIHVATVHHKTSRWIEVQRERLGRTIREPYRVYAVLDGVRDPGFHFSAEKAGTPAERLNFLAREILARASDEDLLIFMDSDSFPITDKVIPFLRSELPRRKLAAVRREENLGEERPHPSFCATTVGFWRDLRGDWTEGPCWRDPRLRDELDIGGRLTVQLREAKVDWLGLLRTNRRDLHPVFFAIYGDLVYHHGAGSRDAVCRYDDHEDAVYACARKLVGYGPGSRGILARALRSAGRRVVRGWFARREDLRERVYRKILEDDEFWRMFL